MEQKLTCSVCGAEVTVVGGEVIRTCEHVDATVIADLKAITYGEGGMQE
jgi:hypothetical protein